MSPAAAPRAPGLIVQIALFALGIVLLAWCIRGAFAPEVADGWRRLGATSPWLLAAMGACTLASLFANGALFHATIRPLQPLPMSSLQLLNLAGTLLNYAPVRLGAVARVAYHLRVDRMPLLRVAAWFAVIGGISAAVAGALLGALLLRRELDAAWALLAVATIVAAVALGRQVGRVGLVRRFGRGADVILDDSRALWTAAALRIVDHAAFAGRMLIGVHVLDLPIDARGAAVLSIVALVANLVPAGRLGIREFCVAAAGGLLGMDAAEVGANARQLALLDTAAEAAVVVPLGAVACLWLQRRLARRPASPA